MKDDRKRIVTIFEKLDAAIQEQVKLVNPDGFSQNLVVYINSQGEKITALRFETLDIVYLIKMSVEKAKQIVSDDMDFNSQGLLKKDKKELYNEKYSDLDYILIDDD